MSPGTVEPTGVAHMSRITALFVGIAALTVVSTVAEAADGCGRGWYYNGRRCVPQDEPGYGYRRDYGPPIERAAEFHGSGWVVQAVQKTLGRRRSHHLTTRTPAALTQGTNQARRGSRKRPDP